MTKLCTICGSPVIARQFCKRHYRAFMKYGDPLQSANLRGVPFEGRYKENKETGCWTWVGAKDTCGYGIWKAHGQNSAHRASYVKHFGKIPYGLCVLHSCDNPACVNPTHLSLGTHAQNMQEMKNRGRAISHVGTKNPSAILTEVQVRRVRKDPRVASALAAELGVSKGTIWAIRQGRIWRHLK